MKNLGLYWWNIVVLFLAAVAGIACDTHKALSGGARADASFSADAGKDVLVLNPDDAGSCVNVCSLHGSVCCEPDLGCVQATGSCTIGVLSGNGTSTSAVYEYSDLLRKLTPMPEVRFSIDTAAVASAATDPYPSGRIEFRLSKQASATFAPLLAGVAMGTPFVFVCNGVQAFYGQIYMQEGAAALNTPVLHHAVDTDGTVILHLASSQAQWVMRGDPVSDRERIDQPALRQVLCARGILRAL